jgi:probable HAF family extracellular repeat protein
MSMLRRLWNSSIPWVTTIALACFSDVVAQTSYRITDLGVLPNDNMACAMAVNNHGWTLEQDAVLDPPITGLPVAGRAVVNIDGLKIDLSTLGGPNSWMNWGGINDRGEAVGIAETSVSDPDGEDVCGFGTKLTCRPFLWYKGRMAALPTLGGNNGQASDINGRGQIAGTADTAVTESGCHNPSQHISLPVIWEQGKVRQLPMVGPDPDGFAFAINDQGQAAGYTGTCGSANAIHAVLWEHNAAFLLDDLGAGAEAMGINNRGQIVGFVGIPGKSTIYGALWENGALTNLGTVPGDFAAIATGVNNRGQVVGSTFDSNWHWAHAFIWQDGVITDLNTLFPADSNLFATMANKINERGQISGMATVLSGPDTGKIHAFLATPVNESVGTSVADVARTRPGSLPANAGKQLLQRLGLGRFQQ